MQSRAGAVSARALHLLRVEVHVDVARRLPGKFAQRLLECRVVGSVLDLEKHGERV